MKPRNTLIARKPETGRIFYSSANTYLRDLRYLWFNSDPFQPQITQMPQMNQSDPRPSPSSTVNGSNCASECAGRAEAKQPRIARQPAPSLWQAGMPRIGGAPAPIRAISVIRGLSQNDVVGCRAAARRRAVSPMNMPLRHCSPSEAAAAQEGTACVTKAQEPAEGTDSAGLNTSASTRSIVVEVKREHLAVSENRDHLLGPGPIRCPVLNPGQRRFLAIIARVPLNLENLRDLAA